MLKADIDGTDVKVIFAGPLKDALTDVSALISALYCSLPEACGIREAFRHILVGSLARPDNPVWDVRKSGAAAGPDFFAGRR